MRFQKCVTNAKRFSRGRFKKLRRASGVSALGSSDRARRKPRDAFGVPAHTREDSRNRRVNFPVSICETAARVLFRVFNTNARLIRPVRNAFFSANLKISPSVREAFSGRRRERRSVTQEFGTKKRDCWHTPPKLFSEFFPRVVILVRASSLLRAHRTTAVAWSPRKRSRIDSSIRSIGSRIALRRNSRGGTRHARLARRVRVSLAFLLNV